MMDAGYCFLLSDIDDHLWIIISNPKLDPDHVLIVNLTTVASYKETVCVLSVGDHPWIRHDSCVNGEALPLGCSTSAQGRWSSALLDPSRLTC
jgi:hypothetical protein